MDALVTRLTERRTATLLVLLVAAAAIAAALFSQHVLGLIPCKLCYLQRQPYYAALPVALALVLLPASDAVRRGGLAVLALLFLVSAGLATYHAGVEWGVFLGPSDCGGAPAPSAARKRRGASSASPWRAGTRWSRSGLPAFRRRRRCRAPSGGSPEPTGTAKLRHGYAQADKEEPMPIILLIILIVLIAQVGFWDTLGAVVGAFAMIVLFILLLAAGLALAAYILFR